MIRYCAAIAVGAALGAMAVAGFGYAVLMYGPDLPEWAWPQ